MSLKVAAIVFDHGRAPAPAATVPLRYDALHAVRRPEWVNGQGLPAVAAYAIDRLGTSVSVLVRFNATPDLPRMVEMRALAEPPGGGPLPYTPLVGDLAPQVVAFDPQGLSAWQAFAFDTAAMVTGGVDSQTLQWRWQARALPAAPWVDVDVTLHRVFALLGVPTEPWRAVAYDLASPLLPRTDVLDFACLWARGARDRAQVAARITEAVNRLGGATLAYDALVGAPHYTVLGLPRFLCDAFLDRLRGGPGAGPLVNCSDCATIVSTFANLLGADLWQSKMGLQGLGFRLNPLLAIGAQKWSTLHGSFGFHEVAWTGDCTEDDEVYDACVSLDGDANPAASPHRALLPRGMRFGHAGEDGYRDRIARSEDRLACVPQPSLRVRRAVAAVALPRSTPLPAAVTRTLAARAGGAPPRADSGYRFQGFRWFGGELGPEWLPMQSSCVDALPLSVRMATWRSLRAPQCVLRVESMEADSADGAWQALLQVAAQIASPALRPWRPDRDVAAGVDDGDAGLALDNGALALFTRGNLLLTVRSAGRQALDVRAPARQLDRWLLGADTTPVASGAAAASMWRRWQLQVQPGMGAQRTRLAVVTPAHAAAWAPSSPV